MCFTTLLIVFLGNAGRAALSATKATSIFAAAIGMLMRASPAEAQQYLWQTNAAGDDVHVIDVATRTVVQRIVVGPEPHGIAAPRDRRVVYVSVEANDRDKGELVWIDPRRYEILHRMTICREPHAIATTPDGRWVYVPCRNGRYWVVDTASKTVAKEIETGGRPHNVRISRNGKHAYLSPMGEPQQVTIVDILAGHRVIGEIPFSGSLRPPALSADEDRYFQHIDGLNGFEVADIASRKTIATVHHGKRLGWFKLIDRIGWLDLDGAHRCHGLSIRPDQSEIWSICGKNANVHSLTDQNYPEIASLEFLDDGYWLTFTPDSRYAFIAIPDADKVVMVDADGKTTVAVISVGRAPARNLVIDMDTGTN